MSYRFCLRGLLLIALARVGGFAQESPHDFELILPDFFTTPFTGGSSVIELPDRPIQKLQILVLNAAERNISSSAIRVWVNGKGMGNVLDSKGVDRGLMLTMDPITLNRRPDELFDAHENTIEVRATDKRLRVFYQSWTLRAGMGQNAYFAYRGEISPNDPQGVPPDVVLESPLQSIVLPAGQAVGKVMLKGLCASPNPPVAIRINGQQVAAVTGKSAPFQQTVDVRRDMKEIVIDASDEKHNRRTVMIPVISSAKAAPPAHFAGTRYALIVGVSRYGDAKDAPPLASGAAVDAELLASHLEEAGFKKENIRLLLDDQATLARLRAGFYDFAAKARGDDLLLVYVAGYGLHDPRPGKTEQVYFAPYGAQLSQIESTALSIEDIDALLNRSVTCNHTFLIFDIGRPLSGVWKFPGQNLVNNHLLNLFSEQAGRAVMVSGSTGEVSQEDKSGSGSIFAHWLAKAFTGDADVNQDHVVTADETFRYIVEKVRQESNGTQNPRYRLAQKGADAPLAAVK